MTDGECIDNFSPAYNNFYLMILAYLYIFDIILTHQNHWFHVEPTLQPIWGHLNHCLMSWVYPYISWSF
jgi:hypothetical protein